MGFFAFLTRDEVIQIQKLERAVLGWFWRSIAIKNRFFGSHFFKIDISKKLPLINYKFCTGVWAVIRIIFEYQLLRILKVCNWRSTPIMHLWGGVENFLRHQNKVTAFRSILSNFCDHYGIALVLQASEKGSQKMYMWWYLLKTPLIVGLAFSGPFEHSCPIKWND